jgi:hypothetical protein
MKTVLRTPTPELARAACDEFDQENGVVEEALKALFGHYRDNTAHHHVLLKVVALDRLYWTNIFAVHDVARHIYGQAQYIDSAIADGSADVIDRIAKVTIRSSGKVRYNYSFATKFCSWHNSEAYPIWDSRVDRYLWTLQKQDHFAPSFSANADLWGYLKFRTVVEAFRNFYGLGSFSFKDIDKFLWSEGSVAFSTSTEGPQSGVASA